MAAPRTYPIVLVDDVPEIREILGFLLEESGWFRVVGEAANGPDAIAVAARTRPSLILLDLDLPGAMAGWDVLAVLRNELPESAVVVLTGATEDLEPVKDEVLGLAHAVIEKGVSNRQLIDRLLGVLGTSTGAPSQVDHAAPRAVSIDDPEAWLAAVVGSSPDAIIAMTLDGIILSWNPAAQRLFGYAPDEVVGRSAGLLVPPDRPHEQVEVLEAVARGARIDSMETVRIHRNGTRVDVQLTVAPVVGGGGEVVGASAVVRDVTARRHTDDALARALLQLERRNRELARSNEELDSFAAIASHDLAQPLQVAYGFLDMLRADLGDALPEHGRQWVDSSLASLERMRSLVRDILRYARTGSGEPKLAPVALADVVADAVSALAVAVADRDADVVAAEDLPFVLGDRAQLGLVLQNVIANAVKFVPPARRPEVRVTASRLDDDVLVRVSDNGVGIPVDQRARVFDMFQRGSGASTGFAGTGLGLSIVKKIVMRHGGGVWVEDGDAGGATVCIRLPAADR